MPRENSGSIRKNDRKEKETHADYKGQANVGGVEYWISAWVKKSEDGSWLSLAFDAKEKREEKPAAPKTKPADDFADDIPF